MAKVTRLVNANAIQWIGTKGSLNAIKHLANCKNTTVSDRVLALTLQFEEVSLEAKINDWVVLEPDGLLIVEEKDFNGTYKLA